MSEPEHEAFAEIAAAEGCFHRAPGNWPTTPPRASSSWANSARASLRCLVHFHRVTEVEARGFVEAMILSGRMALLVAPMSKSVRARRRPGQLHVRGKTNSQDPSHTAHRWSIGWRELPRRHRPVNQTYLTASASNHLASPDTSSRPGRPPDCLVSVACAAHNPGDWSRDSIAHFAKAPQPPKNRVGPPTTMKPKRG